MQKPTGLVVLLYLFSFSSLVQCGFFYNSTNSFFPLSRNRNGLDNERIPLSSRQSKFFPLFTLIRFSNEICTTTSEETGLCFTRTQCLALGGLDEGSCAKGLGVCCKFIATCGSVVTQNGTRFRNPDYPNRYSPMGGSDVCQIRIRRPRKTTRPVCQLRLNFREFNIGEPSQPEITQGAANQNGVEAGFCKYDSLSITSSGPPVPNVCGNMNGQHLIVDFGSSDVMTLNILLGSSVMVDRIWDIEMIMTPCRSVLRAPSGCLQFFTGVAGQLESFNYQGGTHLANMDYSACVRVEEGMRRIDWLPCEPGSVKIAGSGAAATPAQPTACAAANTAGMGGNDYITIPGGISFPLPQGQTTPNTISLTDRFCDRTFPMGLNNAIVRSTSRPFGIHFHTDDLEIPAAAANTGTNDASVGFCLRWQQSPQ